jgi:negative regulator of genetic competence, sporulation and motility
MYHERMVVDMMFTKINDYTVQCVVTLSELDQMGYKLNELYTNREVASNFMRSVMEKGIEEGFELKEHLQEIQVTHFSDQQLVLNFTQVDSDTQINQIISNALDAYEAVKYLGRERLENLQSITGREKVMNFQKMMAEFQGLSEEEKLPEPVKTEMSLDDKNVYMFEFSDLDNLKHLCHTVGLNLSSRLYKSKTKYYLFTDFSGVEQEKINGFVLRALDFEGKIEKNKLVLSHVAEHANTMIEKNAIEALKLF